MQKPKMDSGRLEAFSDGVLAIIVTIMVLEIKVPHEAANFEALKPLLPVFLSYILSFTMVLIYWNNHHHLFQPVESVNGNVLLANGYLLFWLSLLPFVTGWMGENHFASAPVFTFAFVMFMAGTAYYILERVLIKLNGKDSILAKSIGKDNKGLISAGLLFISMLTAFPYPMVSCVIFVLIPVMWIIPDKRIEKTLGEE